MARVARREGFVEFTCPGCGLLHSLNVAGGERPRWTFNGDLDRPTLSPSIRVRWNYGPKPVDHVCHSFVTEGRIRFLPDCTHKLAGQTVELPDLET